MIQQIVIFWQLQNEFKGLTHAVFNQLLFRLFQRHEFISKRMRNWLIC